MPKLYLRNFVAEPMGEKAVTDLAGIGDVLGKRLESKGFDKVGLVWSKYGCCITLIYDRPMLSWASFSC